MNKACYSESRDSSRWRAQNDRNHPELDCHPEHFSRSPERSEGEGSHLKFFFHFILIAFLLSGCATSRLNKKGDEAADEGKYEEAIRYYEESLQKDPDQEETRVKLTETKRTYSVIVWGQANEFFLTGEVRDGLARAQKAINLDPQNTDYKDQFEQKLQEQKRDGDENYKRNKLHEAFEAFDAYLVYYPEDEISRKKWERTQIGLCQEMDQRALELETKGRVGAALAHLHLGQHYRAETGRAARIEGMQKRLLDSLSFTIGLPRIENGTGYLIPIETVQRSIQDQFVSGLFSGTGNRKLSLDLKIIMLRPINYVNSEARQKSYVAGSRNEDNPRYAEIKSKLDDLKREYNFEVQRLRVAETEYDRTRERYEKSRSNYWDYQRAKDRYELQSRRVADLEHEIDQLEEQLRGIPPHRQVEEEKIYYYVETMATKGFAVSMEIKIAGDMDSGTSNRVIQAEVLRTDGQRAAYPLAGLEEDPLVLPSDDEILASVAEEIGIQVAKVLEEGLKTKAKRWVDEGISALDKERKDEAVDKFVKSVHLPGEKNDRAVEYLQKNFKWDVTSR